MLPDFFPKEIRVPYYVTAFRGAIKTRRPLMELLFDAIPDARAKAEALEAEILPWFDSYETLKAMLEQADKKNIVWESGAHRSLFTDCAATLMLLVDAEYDRFFYSTRIGLYERGAVSHVPGIYVSRAIHACANHVKHLPEWHIDAKKGATDIDILAQLVGDPMRTDASAEFVRQNFPDYATFANAVSSAVDGIVTDGSIPETGSAGLPEFTFQPKQS